MTDSDLPSARSATSVVDDYISRIERLSEEDEQALLTRLLQEGYDQGCFLRPKSDDMSAEDFSQVRHLIEALAERERPLRGEEEDPHPWGRDQEPIEDDEPGFLILSQRCDLLAALALEPFVELAFVHRLTGRGESRTARLNSPRWLPVAEDEAGLWIVDLRLRALLPKDRLVEYPARQVVAKEHRPQLRLRLGQRYTRDAVPDEIVQKLALPIGKVLRKNANKDLTKHFSDFLVTMDDDRPRLHAVIGEAFAPIAGDDAYHELEAKFPEEVRAELHEDSGAIHVSQLHFALWQASIKLDFDAASWDEKIAAPDAAEPTR